MNILVIDNFDSFIYNFIDSVESMGHQTTVFRNDVNMNDIAKEIESHHIQAIVLSPGPGTPQSAGICLELIEMFKGVIPIIGICLGHQALAVALDGEVERDERPVHGKCTELEFPRSHYVFDGMPKSIQVGRYHSLRVTNIPVGFEVIATSEGDIQAMINETQGLLGLQFHPESVLTTQGDRLIQNCMKFAESTFAALISKTSTSEASTSETSSYAASTPKTMESTSAGNIINVTLGA